MWWNGVKYINGQEPFTIYGGVLKHHITSIQWFEMVYQFWWNGGFKKQFHKYHYKILYGDDVIYHVKWIMNYQRRDWGFSWHIFWVSFIPLLLLYKDILILLIIITALNNHHVCNFFNAFLIHKFRGCFVLLIFVFFIPIGYFHQLCFSLTLCKFFDRWTLPLGMYEGPLSL